MWIIYFLLLSFPVEKEIAEKEFIEHETKESTKLFIAEYGFLRCFNAPRGHIKKFIPQFHFMYDRINMIIY